MRDGRPLYLLPGKKAVIRYGPESDRPGRRLELIYKARSEAIYKLYGACGRWLIDFEALEEPGMIGRVLRWALNMPKESCCPVMICFSWRFLRSSYGCSWILMALKGACLKP